MSDMMGQSPLAQLQVAGQQPMGPDSAAPTAGNQNQVQISFSPGQGGASILMSVNAPDGSADFDLSLETAMGVLVDLAKVLGNMTGVDVAAEFGDLTGSQTGQAAPGGMGPGGLAP